MAVTEMRVALQPRDAHWELSLQELHGTALALIGWVQEENPIDSGVPDAVARALAGCLTSQYNVTYPTPDGSGSSEWQATSEGWERRLRPGITLVCTHQPEAAMRLFNTHHFSWSMQTQVATFSALAGPPPTLDYPELIQLLERRFDWRQLASKSAIVGVLQPGVDGDFAGLSMFDGGLEVTLSLLRAECERENIGFQIASEAEFRTTTWILGR